MKSLLVLATTILASISVGLPAAHAPVKAFDQIDTGDIVTVQYTEGLAMRMIRE